MRLGRSKTPYCHFVTLSLFARVDLTFVKDYHEIALFLHILLWLRHKPSLTSSLLSFGLLKDGL